MVNISKLLDLLLIFSFFPHNLSLQCIALRLYLQFQICMLYNRRSRKPRGYAFVEYEHERDMHCKNTTVYILFQKIFFYKTPLINMKFFITSYLMILISHCHYFILLVSFFFKLIIFFFLFITCSEMIDCTVYMHLYFNANSRWVLVGINNLLPNPKILIKC